MNPAGCGAARRQGAWDVRWDKKRPRLGCEPPHEVVSGQRWPCSPRSRACCRPVSAQGLCRVRVRFWCWSRDLWCTPAPKFPLAPPVSPTPTVSPCTRTRALQHAHQPSTHARTPRSCSRRLGRGRVGSETFLFLLPSSSSWLFRPPGESESLSPPTPRAHTRGAGSLHAPLSRANAQSCLGGRNLSERGSPSRSAARPRARPALLSLRPGLNRGKKSNEEPAKEAAGSGGWRGPPPRAGLWLFALRD